MSEDQFQVELVRRKCEDCGFTFFTHYLNSHICSTCLKDNDNTKTVNSWEK